MIVIKEFLKYTKPRALKSINCNYVLTNVSCDVDSIVSSILVSFAKNINTITKGKGERTFLEAKDFVKYFGDKRGDDNCADTFFPLINCNKFDFKLRLDIVFLFKTCEIDYENLMFIDELDFQNNFFVNSAQKLVLVDHNSLDSNQTHLSSFVYEIIDHHVDNTTIYPSLKEKLLMFPCGSCSTLVLLNYYIANKVIMDMFKGGKADFLVSAILQDTENFNEKMYGWRWVDIDKFVFETVSEYGSIDREFYKQLSTSKYDVKANLELGLDCLMKKDKKGFSYYNPNLNKEIKVVWSSLQVNYRDAVDFYKIDELFHFYKFTTSNTYDIYLSSSNYNSYKILSIYINRQSLPELKIQKLLDSFNDALKEDLISVENMVEDFYAEAVILFSFTRKNLEPIVKNILSNLSLN